MGEGESRVQGSFRDPSGFVFFREGVIYRQVNLCYRDDYRLLMDSGLYQRLVDEGLLIEHEETQGAHGEDDLAYCTLRPKPVTFISYPYEWCFGQLKAAALTTLQIQRIALDYGLILKDASAYNIQFLQCRPVLIDTLSFERYVEGEPWVAYRQFCQHFSAPLALMSYRDVRLSMLLRLYQDGIPLDLAAKLLPWRTKTSLSMMTNVHLHAKSQRHFAAKSTKPARRKMPLKALLGLLDSLESGIKKLSWRRKDSIWADYYLQTNYGAEALKRKTELVSEYIEAVGPSTVWDLGANTGRFSRIASDRGINTVSFDVDPAAVEENYQQCIANDDTCLLPLVMDLTNPSPSVGWEHGERLSLMDRAPTDVALVLALIHHLAIGNNLPFAYVARFLHQIAKNIIIEFVPKRDSQVQRMLSLRKDVFPTYSQEEFERVFSRLFSIRRSDRISDSDRTLFLMCRR